ncbi:hypothetical protein BDR03DRAFT_984045 [Suillus americanus]|nr:hypothetical protein BDR03DRAFT_984045 [Suillus americanus]
MYQAIAASRSVVIEPSQPMSTTLMEAPPVIDAGLQQARVALCNSVGQEDQKPLKTITAVKVPAPAPASIPSMSFAVPPAALNVPMPDFHTMAMAIQEGVARIAILEAHVAEQDSKIDTLQCLNYKAFDAKLSTGTHHFHFPTLLPMQHHCCLINLSPSGKIHYLCKYSIYIPQGKKKTSALL